MQQDNNLQQNNVRQNQLYYQPYNIVYQRKKPEIKLSKRDLIFALIFFAVSFLIVDFVFFHGFNLGFTITFFVLFSVITVYLFDVNTKVSAFSYICGAMSLAGAVTFSIYNDFLVNTIMLFLVCSLFGIYVCSISGSIVNNQGSFRMLGEVLKQTFVSPFSNGADIAGAYTKVMSKNKLSKNVIIGIALSLPVLIVIIPLLAGSDAAFENLVKIVLKNIGKYLLEAILALIVTPLIILYAVSKKCSKNKKKNEKSKSKGVIQPPVTISFLSVISVTYVIYLLSQLAYFFSAFSGILPKGYSYSASVYARRGFFEMFAICVINMVIIALANILTKRVKGKIPVAVKAVSTFILLFTVLILVTAMAKMKLNIEIFGLSKNRLLVSVFMVMIFVIIIFYIIHIFLPKVSYMQPIIVICSAMFIALSFSDIDGRIARYNIDAYNNVKIDSIDVEYINSLSESSLVYMPELAESSNHKVARQARIIIGKNLNKNYRGIFDAENKTDKITYKNNNDFRSYNFSKVRGEKALADYYNNLSDDGREKIANQYNFDNGDFYYDEERDIYESYSGDYCTEYAYDEKKDDYVFLHRYNIYDGYDESDESA